MESEPLFKRRRFWYIITTAILVIFSCNAFSTENGLVFSLITSGGNVAEETLHALGVVWFNCCFGFLPVLAIAALFISPFILPVKRSSDWYTLLKRMFYYIIGRHGPSIHIKNGKEIGYPGESKRPGPGVILLDQNSAMVLKKRFGVWRQMFQLKPPEKQATSKPRIFGPGIAFSYYDESIQGVVDLRKQLRVQPGVRAHTADGIEVESVLLMIFSVGLPPDVLKVTCIDKKLTPGALRVINLAEKDGGKFIQSLSDDLDDADKAEIIRDLNEPVQPVEENRLNDYIIFYPEKIFSAVSAQVVDQTGKLRYWTEIPIEYAISNFRDRVARLNFDDFFSIDPDKFPLAEYQEQFRKSIRNSGVLSYQYVRNRTGRLLEAGQIWDEQKLQLFPERPFRNPKYLRERGIKIIHAGFVDVKAVNPEVQKQRVETWSARWQKEFDLAMADSELQANRIRNRARVQAQREMVHTLTQILEGTPNSQEAMAVRVFQALESAASEPNTRQLLPGDTINLLHGLRHLLLENQPFIPSSKGPGTDSGSGERREADKK